MRPGMLRLSAQSCVAIAVIVGSSSVAACTTRHTADRSHRQASSMTTKGNWTPMKVGTSNLPQSSLLSSISCPQVDWCLAVGSSRAEGSLTAQDLVAGGLPGDRGIALIISNPSNVAKADVLVSHGMSDFRGVSCTSTTSCLIVGDRLTSSGTKLGAWTFDGSSLTRTQPVPADSPTGSSSFLNSVACATSDSCTAVGAVISPLGEGRSTTSSPIVQTMAAGSWSSVRGPETQAGIRLQSVSCVEVIHCGAAGSSWSSSGGSSVVPGGVVVQLEGSNWSTQHSGAPSAWQSVSCPSTTRCLIAGSRPDASLDSVASLKWIGDGSSAVGVPVKASRIQALFGASCTGTDTCVAVGWDGTKGAVSASSVHPLVYELAGSAATRARVAEPSRGLHGALLSVSCPVEGKCVAVGQETRLGRNLPLVLLGP